MSLPPVPENLKNHPRLGQWLSVGPDGRIHACSGKVDIGQGISHALRLLVAEELQVAPEQVHMVNPSTAVSPDEAVTSGSLSIQHSGASLRYAAAHLRETCRGQFAARAGIDADAVSLDKGVFAAGNERATYADLIDAAMLAANVDPQYLAERNGRPSALCDVARSDVELKVFGEFEFINDMVLPHMVYGAVFRPRTLHAQVDEAGWERLEPQLAAIDGVIKVVRDGLLLGVLAEAEDVLAKADSKLEKANLWRLASSRSVVLARSPSERSTPSASGPGPGRAHPSSPT
ncbi:MAG TPA: molybdopterin cofactor-binding domain-containing protein, partial [Ramlibacter sp.]|nr:molybdopterin cofactor-binding domain-containing protein [Ramlibacter sp.]